MAQPSENELKALQAWANVWGRCWKSHLVKLWMTGSMNPHLQRVRNNFGPSWLYSKHNTITPRRK